MNNVKISVFCDSYKFINYLIYNKINYSSLYKDNDNFVLIVKYEDFKKINRRYKCKIIKYYGKKGIISFIENNKYLILSFIISMFILKLLTMTIFDVRIKTSDKELKEKILISLNNNGIKKYKRKKTFEEIKVIKEKILSENKDVLEWIEINSYGCVYEIDLTKRVKVKEIKEDLSESSIYAKRDGVIKKIVVYSGTKMKDINDYVKKGDVLISGNIFKDENIVNKVKSEGEVFAETWYYASVSVPFIYEEKKETNRIINHYYFDIFGRNFTLAGKFDSKNVESKIKLVLDKPYLPFKLYKETKREYEIIEHRINENDAYKLGLSKCDDEIKKLLKEEDYIISKNVLKKEVNSSKMYIEVFYKIYENIGYTSNIDIKEKEKEDGSNN